MFRGRRKKDKELEHLKKALWKLIINSKEFKAFCQKLAQRNMEVDIFLAMFVMGKEQSYLYTSPPAKVRKHKKNKKPKLSKEDEEFFRKHGIKW